MPFADADLLYVFLMQFYHSRPQLSLELRLEGICVGIAMIVAG